MRLLLLCLLLLLLPSCAEKTYFNWQHDLTFYHDNNVSSGKGKGQTKQCTPCCQCGRCTKCGRSK